MARWEKLGSEIERVKEQYFHRNRLAEVSRLKENHAATQIQSWFRGCKVRVYLSHLHKKATIIQKIWRGFAARARLRQMVKAAYFIMKMNFYEAMALRIQSRWRGFYVRRYIHNYYARKRYLEGLAVNNELVRRQLDDVKEHQNRERERVAKERREMDLIYQGHRLHYLLSTKQCPGIFNSPFRPGPHEMELLLRRIKPRPYAKPSPRVRAGLLGGPIIPSSPPGAPRSLQIGTRLCCSSRPLPPIPSKKPQGPFREPEEVWQQRCRSLEPTLRLQTPYTHLEEAHEELCRQEASGHLPDTPFLPFSRAHQRDRKYERLLLGDTSFLPLAYGTKHFREEDTPRLREKEPFKTAFTSCHVFDKFGRLYSKAGNIF